MVTFFIQEICTFNTSTCICYGYVWIPLLFCKTNKNTKTHDWKASLLNFIFSFIFFIDYAYHISRIVRYRFSFSQFFFSFRVLYYIAFICRGFPLCFFVSFFLSVCLSACLFVCLSIHFSFVLFSFYHFLLFVFDIHFFFMSCFFSVFHSVDF